MELHDIYTKNESGKIVHKSEELVGNESVNTEHLHSTSSPFYLPPLPRLSHEKATESAVLSIEVFEPLPDKFGKPSGSPMIFCGLLDGNIQVYDQFTLSLIIQFKAHTDAVTCLQPYQPPGEALITVLSGSKDGNVCISVALSGDNVGELQHRDPVWSIDIFQQHEMEPIIISSSFDGSIRLWSMVSKELLRRIPCQGGAVLKCKLFAASDVLRLLGKGELESKGHERELMILAAYEDRRLRLWGFQSGNLVAEYQTLPQRITDVVYHIPDGWRMFPGSQDLSMKYEKHYFRTKQKTLPSSASSFIMPGEAESTSTKGNTELEWLRMAETRKTDLTILEREALLFCSCLDGKVYMIMASTGYLLRSFKDESFGSSVARTAASDMAVRPAVIALGTFIPGRVPSFMNTQAFKSDEPAVANPLHHQKSLKGLRAKVRDITHNIKTVTNDAVELVADIVSNTDADPVSTLHNENSDAKRTLHTHALRLTGCLQDGSLCSWNIATGHMFRKFSSIHQGSIPCFRRLGGKNRQMLLDNLFNEQIQKQNSKLLEESTALGLKYESASVALAEARTIMETLDISEPDMPVFITGGVDGLLKVTTFPSSVQTIVEAYTFDKYAKVPKAIMTRVPREYARYPRIYLLAQEYGGLNSFFAGESFKLFIAAIHDNNMKFLKCFLSSAETGFLIMAHSIIMHRDRVELIFEESRFRRKRESRRDKLEKLKMYLKNPLLAAASFATACAEIFFPTLVRLDKSLEEAGLTLLEFALVNDNIEAARMIMDCWLSVLNRDPEHLLEQTAGPHMLLGKRELLTLADRIPQEFERFLQLLKPVRAHKFMQENCRFNMDKHRSISCTGSEAKIVQDLHIWDNSFGKIDQSIIDQNIETADADASGKKVIASAFDSSTSNDVQEELTCFFIPLRDVTNIDFLREIIDVTQKINSISFFDSQVGTVLVSHIWSSVGKTLHRFYFLLYVTSTWLWFQFVTTLVPPASITAYNRSPNALYRKYGDTTLWKIYENAIYIAFVAFFATRLQRSYSGIRSSRLGIFRYFLRDGWGLFELTMYFFMMVVPLGGNFGEIAALDCNNCSYEYRNSKSADPPFGAGTDGRTYADYEGILRSWSYRFAVAVISLSIFVQFLYYLRAFESTGDLIALLLKTVLNMWVYVLVTGIAMFAFGMAIFSLVANLPLRENLVSDAYNDDVVGDEAIEKKEREDDARLVDDGFTNLRAALSNIYSMAYDLNIDQLGNQFPFLRKLMILLAVCFTVFVTIILFNLLIAFISDVFSKMKMLGKAQWKYMQAKTVTEMGVTLEYRYMYDPIKNYLVQPRIIHFCRRNKDMQEENIKAAESARSITSVRRMEGIQQLHDNLLEKAESASQKRNRLITVQKEILHTLKARLHDHVLEEKKIKRKGFTFESDAKVPDDPVAATTSS